MKPLVDITEVIGAEKWVTISAVRPLLYKLLNTHLKHCSSDSRLEKIMKQAMLHNLPPGYTGEISTILNKAAFLDPCFKSLHFFLPEQIKQETITTIEQEAIGLYASTQSSITSTGPPPPKQTKGERKLLNLLSDVISTAPEATSENTIQQELSRYIGEGPVTENPLHWWKANQSRYSTLTLFAKKYMYLAIPATSVPSERAFSHGGHVVNVKKSCLLPDNVKMLVFLVETLP